MQVSRPDQSSISHLLQSLKKSGVNDSELQLTNLQKAQKISSRQSKNKEEHEYRKANYEIVSSNMDKWVPIIKVNREKEHLDFTQKSNNQVRVTFFPSSDNNPLTKRIENKLNSIGVGSEAQLQKKEERILESLEPQEAQQRVNEAIKRSTAFYEEIKRKRISKIKSKLFRKIKKRQKQKQELAKFETLGPEQKEYELEKLRNKRTKERISLRHKIKNKHIQDLMRFQKGDKNVVQNSINELNKIRREQLEKLNDELLKDISEEYDDENFREQALKDLDEEIEMLEEEERAPEQTGLKFMDKANKARIEKEKKEAGRLRDMLVDEEQELQISDQDDANNIDDDGERLHKNREKSKIEEQQHDYDEPLFRKKYDKPGKKMLVQSKPHKKSKTEMKETLQSYINQKRSQNPEEYQQMEVQQPESLIKGINVSNLKSKYQPKRIQKINMEELIENNPDLFDNFEVMENRREFEAEKNKEYQEQLPEQPKVAKGWDSWTGPGIVEPKADPKKELEKKLRQIEEIKRKRKDGLNQDVIIRENRNKIFAREYLVSQLPYNFKSKEQFDYVHQQPVGPEWNSLSNFQQSIKPKIKTKAGETVQPITMPKKIAKLQ